MSGTVATIIVFLGWLLMAVVSFAMTRTALRTGVAPWQFFNRYLGLRLVTRQSNKFRFWYLTAPTLLLFLWCAAGSVVLVLALLGLFGPLE